VTQKNQTPKTGWHNFIKIGPSRVIFHRMQRHLSADWLRLKSLICVECHLHGEDQILIKNLNIEAKVVKGS